MIIEQLEAKTGFDLSALLLNGSPRGEQLIHTSAAETNADVSPDGKWLAFQSRKLDGRDEILVVPFPDVNAGGPWHVFSGGTRPVWGRLGDELFFLDQDGRLMAVTYETTPTFSHGNPVNVLDRSYVGTSARIGRPYDVSRDGQRFLMLKEAAPDTGRADPASIVLVLNWLEELKALLPLVVL